MVYYDIGGSKDDGMESCDIEREGQSIPRY